MRDRGADGVNLDFEPIVSTYADEFTSLVRTVRSELNKVHSGYQLTFDTTGWIGNYPIEAATAGAALTRSWSWATTIAAARRSRRFGRAHRRPELRHHRHGQGLHGAHPRLEGHPRRPVLRPCLVDGLLGAPLAEHLGHEVRCLDDRHLRHGAPVRRDHGGKQRDPVEGAAWTAYKRKNCTAKYGCVTPWRQIYYDDAKALGQKYDLINAQGPARGGDLGAGLRRTRPELYAMLKAKFITDKVPPVISASSVSGPFVSANDDGRMDTVTVRATVTGHLRFGWAVAHVVDGAAGTALRSGSFDGKNVSFTWDGRDDAGKLVPDGTYRITLWTADASDNRASVAKMVTVDRRAAKVGLAAHPSFVTPDGNGHDDTMGLVIRADEAITGSALILDKTGATVRRWALTTATAKDWIWNGHDAAGHVVADGRYTLRVKGLDRAGNRTVRDLGITVDRTIKSLAWARSSFVPRAGVKDRFTMVLRRPATVTVSIYQGSTLVRRIWTGRHLATGAYGWTWSGKTAAGAYVKPGRYRVVVEATSSIGLSHFARGVTVKAP